MRAMVVLQQVAGNLACKGARVWAGHCKSFERCGQSQGSLDVYGVFVLLLFLGARKFQTRKSDKESPKELLRFAASLSPQRSKTAAPGGAELPC